VVAGEALVSLSLRLKDLQGPATRVKKKKREKVAGEGGAPSSLRPRSDAERRGNRERVLSLALTVSCVAIS